MDKFRIQEERPIAKYSEIVRLDKEAAQMLVQLQTRCIENKIHISTRKLISDMVRFCYDRAEFEEDL